MKILIYGIGGKMGKILYARLSESKIDEPIGGVDKFADPKDFNCPVYSSCDDIKDKPDCIIDFSVKDAIYDYLPYAEKNKIPCVIAATGHSAEDDKYISEVAKNIPIFKSGNMSIGVNLLVKIVKEVTRLIGDKADIEIVETHHRRKLDAPSGTALMLAKAVQSVATDTEILVGRTTESGKRTKKQIGISSIRGGTVTGIHEVHFMLDNEVITLKHNAEDRAMFADGSIDAAHFVVGKEPGLYNTMD